MPSEEIQQLVSRVNLVLSNTKARGRESLEVLRQLFTFVVNFNGDKKNAQLISSLADKLFSVIMEIGTPPKIKYLCLFILSKPFMHHASHSQSSSRGEAPFMTILSRPIKQFDVKLQPFIMSLISTSTTSEIHSNLMKACLPTIVHSISIQEPNLRHSSYPLLNQTVRSSSQLLTYTNHVKPIETQFAEFLARASTVSEQKTSGGLFFRSGTPTPITEIDGTVAKEFFTVLNISQNYTEDQIFNIYSFGMIYNWLNYIYLNRTLHASVPPSPTPSPHMSVSNLNDLATVSSDTSLSNFSSSTTDDSSRVLLTLNGGVNIAGAHPTATLTLNPTFQEVIVSYCLRVIDQSKLKDPSTLKPANAPSSTSEMNRGKALTNDNLRLVALVESIRILDILCKLDSSLVSRLFPTLKKVFTTHLTVNEVPTISQRTPSPPNPLISHAHPHSHVLLTLLQFFVNHCHVVIYDPDPLFRAYFENFLSQHSSFSHIAFETLMFCINNKEYLLQHTSVFTVYFPPLLKLIAWFPKSCFSEFIELLPALISPSTFIEMFHTLLDLPLMSGAMENSARELQKANLVASSNAPVPQPQPLVVINQPGNIDNSDANISDVSSNTYRFLYNHLLRNESGVSINFWESSSTLPLLLHFCRRTPVTPRVKTVCEIVPSLLDTFFDVIIGYAPIESVKDFIQVIFVRIDQLYPSYPIYQKWVRDLLVLKVLAIFQKYPSFIITLKPLILDTIIASPNPSKGELIIALIWMIGEYTSTEINPDIDETVLSEYHEALELFAYEKMNFVKISSMENSANPNNNNNNSNNNSLNDSLIDLQKRPPKPSFPGVEGMKEPSLPKPNSLPPMYLTKKTLTRSSTLPYNSSQSTELFTTRLMLVVINSLAKLAVRSQGLISRVALCFLKVHNQQQYFHPSVIQRANECMTLLKFPSIASAIFDSPQTVSEVEYENFRMIDKNSSLPFLLNPTDQQGDVNNFHPFVL